MGMFNADSSLSLSLSLSSSTYPLYCIFFSVCAELLAAMPFEVCFCICVHGINESEVPFAQGEHFVQERGWMHLFVREL